MSSLSSSASSASSTPATASAAFSAPVPGAGIRSHAARSDSLRARDVPGLDMQTERRRATLTVPDRKRRLTNPDGDACPRRPRSETVIEQGSSSRAGASSRPISLLPSHVRPESDIPGSSKATPIELSSSPPAPSPRRSTDSQGPRPQEGNNSGYMECALPRWQPDSEVTECPICATVFSFWFRKHHCRKCGRVVCASCSPHRITIPRQYIVRPPDLNRSPKSAIIPPRTSQIIDLEAEGSAQPPTAINPALGGGEEVRLCNPCVPDPNPEPPRGYTTLRANGEYGSGASWMQGSYLVQPNQSRHRSYHSMSTPTRQTPSGIFSEDSTRPGRRTVGANDYPSFSGFGTSFQERPMRFRASSASQYPSSSMHSSARSFLAQTSSHRPLPPLTSEGSSLSPPRSWRNPIIQRPRVDERDLCPICNRRLPALGDGGNEDEREAHIRECIDSHGSRSRSSSQTGSPATQPPALPVRMIAFTATEKDCLAQEGGMQECTICMEDYEVGQPLVRLECLCKFHKRCIIEWFERKKECPVHKVS